MQDRPLSPAEFAVRFGLEPTDVEWLMDQYQLGALPAREVRKELEVLGCTPTEARRLFEQLAEAVSRRRDGRR